MPVKPGTQRSFFDFAAAKKTLTAGGTYRASIGSRQIVFRIDPGARHEACRSSAACCGSRRPADHRGTTWAAGVTHSLPRSSRSAAGFAAASPAFGLLHGLSIDALTALRWFAFGPARDPRHLAAVVIALDEETYRTPPFAGTPGVTWTREIGRVVTAVIEGGAKVVGFDVVFPTSIEQSEIPFGDETLGSEAARIRPRLPARARGGQPVRQDRARPDPASGSAHPALARPARGRRADAQHPGAERLHGPRQRRAPPAAHVRGRWRNGALDGGGVGSARARRRAGAHGRRRHDAGRLPDSRPPSRIP